MSSRMKMIKRQYIHGFIELRIRIYFTKHTFERWTAAHRSTRSLFMCSLWVCWYEVCVYDVRATMHTCSGRWLCLFKSNRNDGLGKIHIHHRRWHFIGVRYCFIDIGHVLNTCGTGFIHSLFFSFLPKRMTDMRDKRTVKMKERGARITQVIMIFARVRKWLKPV